MDFPPAWTRETDIYAATRFPTILHVVPFSAADAPPAHIVEEDHLVTTRDGAKITVRVYRLRSRPSKSLGRGWGKAA